MLNFKSNIFKNQRILVTGGTGLIGRELIKLLKTYYPYEIISNHIDYKNNPELEAEGITCYNYDLTETEGLNDLFKDIDYVFHLSGIKGSPKMAAEKPASFSIPMLQFNTNALEYARRSNVKWQLYTSSIGVYQPAEILKEDDVWKTFPSNNDKFAGWTKRMGELQIEAYNIEYKLNNISIVRPANVFGNYDNFNTESCMVIPALINRICNGENPLKIWGDGKQVRDFIHAKDVARGMIFAIKNKITEPINLGSGIGVRIDILARTIIECYEEITGKNVSLLYDNTKPTGDRIRLMDMTRANKYGFKTEKSLKDSIKETMEWYLNNKNTISNRYEAFSK